MKRRHTPSCDHWDFCEDLPVTQCFDPRQAELLHSQFFGQDADLFRPPISPLHYIYQKQLEASELQQWGLYDDASRRGTWRSRVPKAVDEDLYKIPPEQLYRKKSKRRIVMGDFVKRCLGLICIA